MSLIEKDNCPEEELTNNHQRKIELINTWYKIIIISAITFTILYKILLSSFNLSEFNFSDLLSLILAIFSIGLSVMFYIKADETSNRFYDNTQKFTQNVSNILGRIEAGFGERLRHIDEGYNKLEGYYRNSKPERSTNTEIEKNEEDVKKAEKQKDIIIQDLLQKAKLQDAEKQEIIQKLEKYNEELQKTRSELSRLRDLEDNITSLTPINRRKLIDNVLEYFSFEATKNEEWFRPSMPIPSFIRKFNEISKFLSSAWIDDLILLGWCTPSGKLTEEGAIQLRRVLRISK